MHELIKPNPAIPGDQIDCIDVRSMHTAQQDGSTRSWFAVHVYIGGDRYSRDIQPGDELQARKTVQLARAAGVSLMVCGELLEMFHRAVAKTTP